MSFENGGLMTVEVLWYWRSVTVEVRKECTCSNTELQHCSSCENRHAGRVNDMGQWRSCVSYSPGTVEDLQNWRCFNTTGPSEVNVQKLWRSVIVAVLLPWRSSEREGHETLESCDSECLITMKCFNSWGPETVEVPRQSFCTDSVGQGTVNIQCQWRFCKS